MLESKPSFPTPGNPLLSPARYLQPTDLQGLAQLAGDGVAGTSRLVEQLHLTIARLSVPVGPAVEGSTRGITGLVYQSVRGVNALVGGSIKRLGDPLVRRLATRPPSAERERWLAALNGVLGDHLADTGNPLSIPMSLCGRGSPLVLERNALAGEIGQPSGRLLIAVHGLCMNHLHWGLAEGEARERDMPARLARAAGFTPLYLHYNSGRPIADNGDEFAGMLEQLVEQWPVPVEEVLLLGHSMGGLVARSARHHGEMQGHGWPRLLRRMMFLGTPHHGAPLERAGHGFERVLGISPYSAPFIRLGSIRSAGIVDLRHGHVADTETRASSVADRPEYFAVAATTRGKWGQRSPDVIGDGLVPVESALGWHEDPARDLGIPEGNRRVVAGIGHIGLLHHPEVYRSLRRWLR